MPVIRSTSIHSARTAIRASARNPAAPWSSLRSNYVARMRFDHQPHHRTYRQFQ